MRAIVQIPTTALISAIVFGASFLSGCARVDEAVLRAERLEARYADLDLTQEADATELYRRVRLAAERACGDIRSPNIMEAAAAKDCVYDAVESSARAVNNLREARLAVSHRDGQRLQAQATMLEAMVPATWMRAFCHATLRPAPQIDQLTPTEGALPNCY
jgi:UrcA family protein